LKTATKIIKRSNSIIEQFNKSFISNFSPLSRDGAFYKKSGAAKPLRYFKDKISKMYSRSDRKTFVYMIAFASIVIFLSFSNLTAEDTTFKLIPDERNHIVWRVGSNGTISKIDFPIYYENPQNCNFCSSEIWPSPDQSKIAYIKRNDLWIYDIETKKDKRCTRVGRPYEDRFTSVYVSIVAWSPDSHKIIYSVCHGELQPGDSEIPDKVPNEKYGEWVYDIAKHARTSLELRVDPADPPVWLPNNRILFISAELPLSGEICLYDPVSHEKQLIIKEHAWYTGLKISIDGKWAMVHAGQTVGQDPTGTDRTLRSQLRKINLENGRFVNVTPLGGWGDYWSYAISPSGKNIAYFLKKSSHPTSDNPNNYRGSLIVNGVSIYSSDLLAEVFWITDKTIIFKTDKELLVLDSLSGKVIGSHLR
jgi:hypothetical protein